MDGTTYRILHILSQNLDSSISINEVTKNIDKVYGGAYYANIHQKIRELDKKEFLILTKANKSSLIFLHFHNYMVTDMLAEMELQTKNSFLKERYDVQRFMSEFSILIRDIPLVSNVLLMYPEKNVKLNKVELLICLQKSTDKKVIEKTKLLLSMSNMLQVLCSIKVDYIVLESQMFFNLLKSNTHNPVREMLHNKIAILNLQSF